MFSVAILTLNEEVNLPGCLESVAWADDVVIFDSGSTDGTAAIARRHGRPVCQHPFVDYAAQRMACLDTVPFRHEWVFFLDADERFTPQLRDELLRVLPASGDDVTLYRVRRRDHFLGRWIRRSSGYPTWFGRLVRRGRVRITRPINELYETDGGVGLLHEHLEHFPFNRGIEWWLDRHNRYSSMEARQLERDAAQPQRWGDLLASDPQRRRAARKALAYRLPLRPLLAFLYLYVLRRGFLEGRAGLQYALLRATYEMMIDVKRHEGRIRDRIP